MALNNTLPGHPPVARKPKAKQSLKAVQPVNVIRKVNLQISKQPATLRLIVEGRLRSAISAGDFKPGQRLIERELCELTGVGRTSIREALRQLEAEGLITNIPHRGPSVSTISAEEAQQLYRRTGWTEIDRFNDDPYPDTFFEKHL